MRGCAVLLAGLLAILLSARPATVAAQAEPAGPLPGAPPVEAAPAEPADAAEPAAPPAASDPDQYESTALAEDELEEARLLFLAGRRAFDSGRYEDALDSFERAYVLTRDPHVLYNVAITLDRMRRDREALAAFERYLRLQPEAPENRDVESRIRILRAQIREHDRLEGEAARRERAATTVLLGDDRDDRDGVLGHPWLWATLGVLGAAAVGVLVAFLVTSRPAPEPGAEGVVLFGLRGP